MELMRFTGRGARSLGPPLAQWLNGFLRVVMATRGAGTEQVPRRSNKEHAIRKRSGYTVSLRHARGGPRANRGWRAHATAPPNAAKAVKLLTPVHFSG